MTSSHSTKGKSPIEMLYHWEKETPNNIYLRQPIDNQWHDYSFAKVANEARCLTQSLFEFGFKKGDKIALISKNCAQWVITDLALQLGGFVSVPLYFDQTPESFKYILEHSDAKGLFVGKLEQGVWNRLKNHIPKGIIKMGFSFHGQDADCQKDKNMDHLWQDLISLNQPLKDCPVPNDKDPWTIIYTSGTTGHPKGAVHNYAAPRFIGGHIMNVFNLGPQDSVLSFLPLAHVAERILVEANSLYCGMQICFIQSQDTFKRDLTEVQPSVFFSVPRLWKKFQGGILEKVPQKKLDLLLKIPLVNGFISRKLRHALGLSNARFVISGAAPLSVDLLEWYAKLGIEILEGYGMTENFAYGFMGRPGNTRPGTVGTQLPDSGFKISEQGEVLFKSPALMQGYYKDPIKTKEAFNDEGYLLTGDMGELDKDGNLKITGRIKETFKTEKGEYVAPAPIEARLASLKDFEQICLAGLGLCQPVVVATLSVQATNKPAAELENKISDHIKQINLNLLNHEKIGGVILSNEDWQPDTGLVTPTLKVKRNMIEKRYGKLMAQAVNTNDNILWESK